MDAVLSRAVTVTLVLLSLVAAGAAPGRALPLFGSQRPGIVEVGVRELPADDAWQVSFRLPAKAAGVELVHGRGAHRRAAWSIPAGAHWVDAPDVERLCFARPSRELAISFRSDVAPRPKDYAVNLAMSDGGRLLYTGHLVVRPLEVCAPGAAAQPAPRAVVHQFRFDTAEGRSVRVGDRAATPTLGWSPAAGAEETYVYFGPQGGASGDRFALVADPALPAWLRRDLEPTVTALLDRFAGETGIALPVRPLLLLSFDPRGSGRSLAGGVVGAAAQLSASGDGWLVEDAEGRRTWTIRLAHQLFRLWGGALLHPDAESEWLAAAAAESFALRAAYGVGVLTDREVAETLVDRGNQCLARLDGKPLLSAAQPQGWESWYSCGPVLLFVAGQAVERAHPGEGGLGLLVRRMFAEGQAAGGVYGTGTFLGWLDKLSGDRPTVFALQGIIRRGVPRGADRVLAGLLTGAGYRVALAAPADAKASPAVFGALLGKALARCACGAGDPPATVAGEVEGDCARFSGPARVVRVDDVEAGRDPAGAYARLRAAAGLSRPVRVVAGDDPQPLTLFCGRDALDPTFEQLLRLQ